MPLISSTSYTELPGWLQGYAKEAAIAARNLGVNVVPPPQGSPPGTNPTVTTRPYQPYRGDRFAMGPDGRRPTNDYEHNALTASLAENPLTPSVAQSRGYLDRASVGMPASIANYMNPDIQGLLNQIDAQGMRKMQDEVSPALEAKYVRLGQHGGRSHQRMAARAARDIQGETSALRTEALENEYEQATKAFGQERSRDLETSRLLSELGNLENLSSQGDMNSGFQVGSYRRGLEERPMIAREEEFRREQKHPYETINFLISALNGVPSTQSTKSSVNIPPAPQPSRSMHGSDYLGMMAQLAPMMRRSR